MIVSHPHRFLFIHTPKTGGSSVSVSLARYLEPGDIYIGAVREALKEGIARDLITRNIYRDPAAMLRFVGMYMRTRDSRSALSNANKFYHRKHNALEVHSGWEEILESVGREKWDSCFKFAFERNPWDKMVSRYFWNSRVARASGITFDAYLAAYRDGTNLFSGKPVRRPSSWSLYGDDDGIRVDAVGRYERLTEDLRAFMDRAGIDWDGWLPGAKSQHRPDMRHYRTYYNDETRRLVASIFQREIEYFGYEF